MDGEQAKYSRARIIGTSIVVVAYALAIGFQLVISRHASPEIRDRTKIARETTSPARPRLKPVPPHQYPLTLANDPAAYPTGVINADHHERELSESDPVIGTFPFHRNATSALEQ